MENEPAKKFRIVSLGCRTNQYEAQAFQDQLLAMGFSQATEGEAADLCIVNTCTVTANADKDSRHAIRNLARQNPHSRIAVTGCGVESQREAIAAIPEVSDIIPNASKEELVQRLFPDEEAPEFSIEKLRCSHARLCQSAGRLQLLLHLLRHPLRPWTFTIATYERHPERSPFARRQRLQRDRDHRNQCRRFRWQRRHPLVRPRAGSRPGARCKAPRRSPPSTRMKSTTTSSMPLLSGQHTCPSMHIVLQSGSTLSSNA